MKPASDPDQRTASLANGAVQHGGVPDGAPAPVSALAPINAALIEDVTVTLSVKLGDVVMSVGEVLSLKAGAVVKLTATLNEPVDVRLNGAAIARGEIVAVGDHFAVRILEVADQ